jgi:O-antigen ligase
VCLYCGHLVFSPGAYENHILDWICFFWILVLTLQIKTYDFSVFFKRAYQYTFLATFCVLALAVNQMDDFPWFPSLYRNEFPSSLFGFQNMTAEFIGAAILFFHYKMLKFQKAPLRAILFTFKGSANFALLLASVYYLFVLQCRSVFVALTIVSFLPLIFTRSVRAFFLPFLMCLGLVLNSNFATHDFFIPFFGSEAKRNLLYSMQALRDIKKSNTQIRINRWKNASVMLRDFPLGVGPGNFEFAYQNYYSAVAKDIELTESNLVRSPHNAYIGILVELGVVFFIVFLVLGALTGFRFFLKICQPEAHNLELQAIFNLMAFFLLDALFAFPAELAFPFFCFATMGGLMLGQIFPRIQEVPTPSNRSSPIFFAAMAVSLLIIVALGFCCLQSHACEKLLARNYPAVRFACNAFPSNWRVCLTQARLELESGLLGKAEVTAKRLLKAHPDFYPGLLALAPALFYQQKKEEHCEVARKYDQIFFGKSLLHRKIVQECE